MVHPVASICQLALFRAGTCKVSHRESWIGNRRGHFRGQWASFVEVQWVVGKIAGFRWSVVAGMGQVGLQLLCP